MTRAVIGLASNVNPHVHIEKAAMLLEDQFCILAKSTFVKTPAIGSAHEPPFINGVLAIDTVLDQAQLTFYLKKFEKVLGRVADSKEVTIDLDLYVFDGKIVHNDVHERDFVKKAIEEIS